MFSTIIHRNADGTQETYHGIILEQHEEYFVFGFKLGGRNYVWECRPDYWELRV
jgi:hypothetical protein